MLGLRALGVTSVLLMRGQKIPKDHPVKASMIFDASGRELVALAAGLAQPDPPGPGKEFFIGIGARAFRPSRIPDAVIRRLEKAADPEREGIEICAEAMRELALIPGVSGVNLMTMGNPQSIRDAIAASGLRG